MKISNLLAILLAICLLGCQKELPPTAYVDWVRDPANGLLKSKEIGDLRISALLKSPDYILASELKKKNIDSKQINGRLQELGDMIYIDLKLGTIAGDDFLNYNVTSAGERDAHIYYLSYRLQQDLKLIAGTDTLTCGLFHFERSYQLGKNKTFVLGFPRENANKIDDITLVLDSAHLGSGPVKLKFEKEDLDKTPTLKY